MNSSAYVPSYKQQFISTLSRDPKKASTQQASQTKQAKKQIGLLTKTTATNDVWHKTSYGTKEWKGHLYNTFYKTTHNETQHIKSLKTNPEVTDRTFNMRRTQISEFSNALYNSTVFINPRFSSC